MSIRDMVFIAALILSIVVGPWVGYRFAIWRIHRAIAKGMGWF